MQSSRHAPRAVCQNQDKQDEKDLQDKSLALHRSFQKLQLIF